MQKAAKQARERGISRANTMREKALSSAKKRKEEFLGARVPRELRLRVIERAEALGIPVSLLIRKILEDAFQGHSPVAKSTLETSQIDRHDRPDSHGGDMVLGDRFPSVLGWEGIRLNRGVKCSACGRQLEAGSKVTLGLAEPGEEHVILCNRCKGPT